MATKEDLINELNDLNNRVLIRRNNPATLTEGNNTLTLECSTQAYWNNPQRTDIIRAMFEGFVRSIGHQDSMWQDEDAEALITRKEQVEQELKELL
jgi:hypothetical protein